MNEFLQTTPFLFLLIVAFFSFAVVMMPVFVWIICARLKRTNQILARIEKQGGIRRP